MAPFTKTVPDEMWSAKEWEGDAEHDLIAVIACPCGEEPEVAQLATTVCGCGRVFILAGERVLVAAERAAPQQE
jgi:hypothetical protein